MSGKFWIRAAVLAAATAAVPPRALLAQPVPSAEAHVTSTDLGQQLSLINDPNSTQGQRDEAARRLVSRHSDEAMQMVLGILKDQRNNNGKGQLAVAKALARETKPRENLVDPLFVLLRSDKPLADAAAQALGNYKERADVLTRLINFAITRDEQPSSRIAAIRAIGTFPDKRAASTLAEGLLFQTDDSDAIHDAAADALVEMTGLRDNDRDVQQWQKWWKVQSARPEADFRAEIVTSRAVRLDLAETRLAALSGEIYALLTEQYQTAQDEKKTELLLRYLKANDPAIRLVGPRIVLEDFMQTHPIAPTVFEQLRRMVGDSSPEVRLEVARAIHQTNDKDAIAALLTQLPQENDPQVRAELARALGPIGNLSAVPPLLELLNDTSTQVVLAACDALRQLAPKLVAEDPNLAATVAQKLQDALSRTGVGATGLRSAIIDSMSPLKNPGLLNIYQQLLDRREASAVRRAALRAIAELGDTRAAGAVTGNALDDPDPLVRREALNTLKHVATFGNAESLYRRLNPSVERDPENRDKAWEVLEVLFPSASADQLKDWTDRFPKQPQHKLTVLYAYVAKLIKNNKVEELATRRQEIGVTLMELKEPADAARYFKLALDYYAAQGKAMVTAGLRRQYMQAMLQSKQYMEAVTFAQDDIKEDPSEQQLMGGLIRNEVQAQKDAGNAADAAALIKEVKKMEPPLAEPYKSQIGELESDLNAKTPATGAAPAK